MKKFFRKKESIRQNTILQPLYDVKGEIKLSPQTKEGVEKIPSQYAEYKRHAYDSYIKKALRHELFTGLREKKKRLCNEVVFSELPDVLVAELAYLDDYPWEYTSFYVDGHVILIRDNRLADALEQLPQKERTILLMHYFLNMSDCEIAVRMRMARRTINDHRHFSCRLLRKLMGGDLHE